MFAQTQMGTAGRLEELCHRSSFKNIGAEQSKRKERNGDSIMKVYDLMTPGTVTVDPKSSAATAAKLLSRHNVGVLPVCTQEGRLQGVVTDRDIVLRCVAAQEDPEQTSVEEIMTRGCATVASQDDCQAAARIMAQKQVRRLPVVDDGRLVGMLSLGDLAVSQRHDMEAAYALSEISENVVRHSLDSYRP